MEEKELNWYNQRKQFITKVRNLWGKGYTDEEIALQLDASMKSVQKAKAFVLERDRDAFNNLDTAAVYSDYLTKSRSMVARLQALQIKFKKNAQWTALVAAIKEEKELYDSCIKYGQEFGFIEKKPQQLDVNKRIKADYTFTTKQIQNQIDEEVKKLNDLASGKVIDMRPELLGVVGNDVMSEIPRTVFLFFPARDEKREKPKKAKMLLRK